MRKYVFVAGDKYIKRITNMLDELDTLHADNKEITRIIRNDLARCRFTDIAEADKHDLAFDARNEGDPFNA